MTIAPLLLFQLRPRRLHQHHRADDVDVEGREPIGARRVGAVVEIGAGDIDQISRAARSPDRRFDQCRDVGVAGDVAADEARLAADCGRRRLAVGHVDVGDDHGAAIAGERCATALSDQRRAARDDCRLAVEPAHGAASLWSATRPSPPAGKGRAGHCPEAARRSLSALCAFYPLRAKKPVVDCGLGGTLWYAMSASAGAIGHSAMRDCGFQKTRPIRGDRYWEVLAGAEQLLRRARISPLCLPINGSPA